MAPGWPQTQNSSLRRRARPFPAIGSPRPHPSRKCQSGGGGGGRRRCHGGPGGWRASARGAGAGLLKLGTGTARVGRPRGGQCRPLDISTAPQRAPCPQPVPTSPVAVPPAEAAQVGSSSGPVAAATGAECVASTAGPVPCHSVAQWLPQPATAWTPGQSLQ